MDTKITTYSELITWLEAAPRGKVREIADLLKEKKPLLKYNMNILKTMCTSIGMKVALVDITWGKHWNNGNTFVDSDYKYSDALNDLYKGKPITESVPSLIAIGDVDYTDNGSLLQAEHLYDESVLSDLARNKKRKREDHAADKPKKKKKEPLWGSDYECLNADDELIKRVMNEVHAELSE